MLAGALRAEKPATAMIAKGRRCLSLPRHVDGLRPFLGCRVGF